MSLIGVVKQQNYVPHSFVSILAQWWLNDLHEPSVNSIHSYYRGKRPLGSNWFFDYDVEDGRNELLDMEVVLVPNESIGKKMDTIYNRQIPIIRLKY